MEIKTLFLSGQRGTVGKAQNIATGQDRPGKPVKLGTGWGTGQLLFSVKIWDRTQGGTGESQFFSYDFLF